MQLKVRANGQNANVIMEQAGDQVLAIGQNRYRPARLAHKVRKLANKMWGRAMPPDLLDRRLYFEAHDMDRIGHWGDSGSFTPATGASVVLGRWDEDATVGIALHEFAHEMHLFEGGYDQSENVVREALALLAEREAGLVRSFDREPYYTASNLVAELCELHAFSGMPFHKRWSEMSALTSDTGLADLVNYYLDKTEGIGLARWLNRFSDRVEVRDALLNAVAVCSLRYSLAYRRSLLKNLVRTRHDLPLDRLYQVLDAVMTLDQRYPDDDLSRIIDFCFEPIIRPRRGLLAFGS